MWLFLHIKEAQNYIFLQIFQQIQTINQEHKNHRKQTRPKQ